MACAKVLQTTELLELILSNVPCRDLLLSQRVNRTWRATIQESIKLKRALFLAPAGPVVAPFGSKRIRNQTDTTFEIEYTPGGNGEWFRYAIDEESTQAHSVTMNPLMARLFPILGPGQIVTDVMRPITSREKTALNRQEASWREMLVCQPPVSSVHAKVEMNDHYDRHRFYVNNVEPIGLGMGGIDGPRSVAIWRNEVGLNMSDLAAKYDLSHDKATEWPLVRRRACSGASKHRPTRVLLREIFTWWRPRPEHVTAETTAADVEPYAWSDGIAKLNVRPVYCDEPGTYGSKSWQSWTS